MGMFRKIGQQIELMNRLIAGTRIGGSDSQVINLENDIKQAMSLCDSCQDMGGCMKWRDEAGEADAQRQFCTNSARMEQLQRSA